MARNLSELAAWVSGTLLGDGSTPITGAAPLGVAKLGDITLVDTSEKAQRLGTGSAAAAIVPRGFTPATVPAIQVNDVHAAFAQIVAYFHPPLARPAQGISPQAQISPTARIAPTASVLFGASVGDNVVIGPGCVIHPGVHILPGCTLAENVTIFPNVVLYENTVVGPRAIIHAGAVIGAYGFGYKLVDGKHQLSAQLGYVELGADVEVGACTTIDRGAYGPTVIGEGTKLDNQVMIAHTCRLGRHNLICSQVGIAGSTSTGDYVVMAGQVGVRDHVHIGDRAVLGAKCGISNDVPAGEQMLGIPATPIREQKHQLALLGRLPEQRKQLKMLAAAVALLQQQTSQGPGQAAA